MEKPKKLSLKTEIENEARQIEREIAEHPELEDVEVTEEMDRALWAKIAAYEREKAAETEDVEAAEELMPDISRIPVERRKVRKRKYRMWAALAAVLVLVMGIGVTSVGSKSYWKVLFERITGKAPVQITNVEDMDSMETEEKTELDAYKEIEEILKTPIVRIRYMPRDMFLKKYMIDKEMQQAQMFFEYKNEILKYAVYGNEKDSSTGKTKEDIKSGEYVLEVKGHKILIKEYKSPDNRSRLNAEFEYQGVQYSLSGVIKKEEFQKIVKSLKFYEK